MLWLHYLIIAEGAHYNMGKVWFPVHGQAHRNVVQRGTLWEMIERQGTLTLWSQRAEDPWHISNHELPSPSLATRHLDTSCKWKMCSREREKKKEI